MFLDIKLNYSEHLKTVFQETNKIEVLPVKLGHFI